MAYPLPIQFESRECLYKQAMFFYNEYKRVKAERDKWRKVAGQLAEALRDWEEGRCPSGGKAALKAYEEMTTK